MSIKSRGTLGSVHDDRMRRMRGQIYSAGTGAFSPEYSNGVFSSSENWGYGIQPMPDNAAVIMLYDNAIVVNTGDDNAPSTYAVNYWRLINLQ